ncbi:aminopeptidase P family protein [Rapidithrix thailandica]|uniref:Xaa-Pro aminopeptidase n=1 Tax=Rapidithrix thailandica TaxID=413964 RepID=A0AAW9SG18_9BACT
MKMFSAETYKQRREGLKKQLSSGIVLFMGNEEVGMNFKDNVYHFRQDSSFLYYFGIDVPGLVGIMDLDEGTEIIFGNELSIDDIVWTGPLPTIAELAANAGVSQTRPTTHIEEILKTAKAQQRTIHFLPPYRSVNKQKIQAWLEIHPEQQAQEASVELIKAVVAQREIKSEEELQEIDKAVNITSEMHLTAMKGAKPGLIESQLTGLVHGKAISGGGDLSFPIILTVNGQVLHNHYHGNTLKEGQMVLCDCGAEAPSHYAGDMTRTFPVGKQFTERQRELYQIVIDAHEAAVAALKPGVRFKDIHLLACKTLAEGLKGVGLMKGDVEEAVNQGAHTLFFQCGLGHMMGLDVHDMEDLGEQYVGYDESLKKSTEFGLKSLRLGKALQKGFVVTVEPGIYMIPELIDMWKSEGKYADFVNYDKVETYKDFGGIRVEEDFVITGNGADLLGTPVAKSVSEVEAVRASSF